MRFEIYETQARLGPMMAWEYEWRWRLRARNGRIVADGAEGYSSKSVIRRALRRLQASFSFMLSDTATSYTPIPVVEVES